MGEGSKIAWTNNTFNPVKGCDKVSEGCKFCYAERDTKRYGLKLWGATARRERTTPDYWKQPHKWNKRAQQAGKPELVFCASWADVGEDHPDWIEPRRDLARLIEATPWLVWLLLTKRPQNMVRLFGEAGWTGPWPTNVWAGTTVENKKATERIDDLFGIPAALRFLSCEPLLEGLDLTPWIVPPYPQHEGEAEAWEARYGNAPCGLDWVIVGGESGPGARPFDLSWARSIRDQCKMGSVPFFFKQTGDNPILSPGPITWPISEPKGGNPADWPEDLRIQDFPLIPIPTLQGTQWTKPQAQQRSTNNGFKAGGIVKLIHGQWYAMLHRWFTLQTTAHLSIVSRCCLSACACTSPTPLLSWKKS